MLNKSIEKVKKTKNSQISILFYICKNIWIIRIQKLKTKNIDLLNQQKS